MRKTSTTEHTLDAVKRLGLVKSLGETSYSVDLINQSMSNLYNCEATVYKINELLLAILDHSYNLNSSQLVKKLTALKRNLINSDEFKDSTQAVYNLAMITLLKQNKEKISSQDFSTLNNSLKRLAVSRTKAHEQFTATNKLVEETIKRVDDFVDHVLKHSHEAEPNLMFELYSMHEYLTHLVAHLDTYADSVHVRFETLEHEYKLMMKIAGNI